MKNKNLIGALALVLLTAAILGGIYWKNRTVPENTSYLEFLQMVEENQIAEVTLTDGAWIKFKLVDSGLEYLTENPRNPALKEELLKKNIPVAEGSLTTGKSVAGNAASIVFFCAVLFFVYRASNRAPMKSAMALNVTDASASQENSLCFDDIAGNEEAKDSVEDIVDFIRNPDKYARYGARMPRGVIFYGPPGTGKTLMAKAIAGEAGAPFYAVSGSDFVQMYVGVGASRVRELFQKARADRKAVIFIDEIDALGKKRSSNPQGGNDEREQTLNALLTEMSGFASGEGIVVIAATNRLDTLDEALLRPGRFDRQVEIGLPDLNARRSILNLHQKNKPISGAVNMNDLARQTVYFSGAMLENLLNEAAIFAAKRAADNITLEDIDKAYYTVVAGSEKKDRSGAAQKERQITAYHESGHALAAKFLSPENMVAKITIIPSTKGAGGFCVNIPPDKMYYTKKELESQIMIHFAGRAAEEIIFGADNVTTGASNDFEKARSLIQDYVMKYGMGKSLLYSEEGAREECRTLLEDLYIKTKKFLISRRDLLNAIAEELLRKETLTEGDLNQLVEAA
ncbi:MAG: AAA family ATPase [Clostridiales bacterium]|jgi:cell division protease FtsH|nr:AAA family ATPase [Clostridiales bacterium]